MSVRIYGSGFSTTAGDNSVTFGGTSATVDSAKSTVLYVQVPSGPSGPVDVEVSTASGLATAPTAFSVVTGGPASFPNAQVGLVGTEFGSVEWADFNNDGTLDLLVTGSDTSGSNSARVYLADGSGGYTTADAGLTGVESSSSAVGDVNGDNVLDIVLTGDAGFDDPTTKVYLGDGTGGFTSANAGLTGVLDGSSSLGDVDGDGDLDLVLTGKDSNFNPTATLYLGDGSGGFTSADAGLTGVENGSSSLGDVDGDGNIDLIVSGQDSNNDASTTVYLGDGTGGFAPAGANLLGYEQSASALGDVNGDGDLDLVLTGDDSTSSTTTTVYLGEAGSGFTAAGAGVSGLITGSVSLGDLDGDGALDLILTGSASGDETSAVYLGDGSGQFSESNAVLTGVENGEAAMADADGDGDLDVALAGKTGLNDNVIARLYRNEAISEATSLGVSRMSPRFGVPGSTVRIEGSGFTSSTTVTFGGISATVTGATSTTLTVTVPTDASGPVPVTVEESGTTVTAADRFTVVSGGSGTLTGLGTDLETVDNAASAWADFDEDGQLDLLLTGTYSSTIYLRDGSGGFAPANAGLLDVNFSATDVGDVNGDGHLDVVLAGQEDGSGPITVMYLGDGTGSFTRAEAALRGLDQGSSNFGDLNGDGHLDLVVTGNDETGDPHTDVYLGYGDGQFTRAGAGLPGFDQSSSTVGDLDRDGTLDFVVMGEDTSFSKQTKVYLGDGSGGFNDANAGLTGVVNGSVELGDVDGDDDLDLVLTGSDSNGNAVTTMYLGDGSGGFGVAEASLPGFSSSASDLGDVNGDGTLDLVLTGINSSVGQNESALFLGMGTGHFTRAGLGLLGGTNSATKLGDLDGDGDLDLAVTGGGSFGGSYVYENKAITAATGLSASNLRPRTGTAGDSVRVEGSGFTSSTTATLGGSSATVGSFTNTSLTAEVPGGERGPVPVTVEESATSVTAADRFTVVEDDSASFSGVATNLGGVASSASEWADFNEDGKLDLLLTGSGSATVYLGNETGFFTQAGAGLDGVDHSATDVGDVNDDGHLDIVISGSGKTSLYLGDGTAGFTEAPALFPGLRVGSTTFGDINNDGHLDLLLTGTRDNDLTFPDPFTKVYLGYGDGRFAGAKTNVTPVLESTTSFADLNNDGNLDLVATGDSTGGGNESTSVYFGDGTGAFSRAGLGLTGVKDGSSNVGDFNNDGNVDLFITGLTPPGGESSTIYLGDGSGGFSTAGASLTPVKRSSADVGDVNGDGNLDLTLSGFAPDNVEVSKVYLGDGNGGFSAVGAGLDGVNDGSSDFGDLDGDGELDLVVTGFDASGNESVFLYENGPLANPPLRVTGIQPKSAAPGESIRIYGAAFDTSSASNNTVSFGGTDATASSVTSTSLTVTVPSGVSGALDLTVTTPDSSVTAAERFTAVTGGGTTYAPIGNLVDVAESSTNWADFNNDSNLDLFVSGDSTGGGTAAVYLGDGSGRFTLANAGLTGVERSASAVGDLDNDGNLDLVVVGDAGGSFSATVYLGNGSGDFSKVNSDLPGTAGESVTLGDLDGDGILDLILTGGDTPGVYLGDGTGRFIHADLGLPGFAEGGFGNGSSDVGDVNGDGSLDFVVTGSADFQTPGATVFLGDGTGGFTAAGAGLNGVVNGTSDFGDVNGDGTLDLLITGDSTSDGNPSATLYLGDGSGGFTGADAGITGVINGTAEIGDLDGDGNRDLFVAGDSTGGDDPSTTFYLGDGSGGFTETDVGFTDVRNGSSALGDLDGDGDLDPVLTGHVKPSSTSPRRTLVYQNESITGVTGLAVTALRPRSGPPGSTVRIEGSGFSATASNNTVTFGGVEATVTRATTTALTVTVPSGVNGRVSVAVSGTTAPERFSVVTDGNTTFTELGANIWGVRFSSVEWADFNNDETLDLLVTGDDTLGSASARVYLGDGLGGYGTADAGLTGVSSSSSAAGDVNSDGHLDLVVTGRDADGARTTTVYLGDGTGQFTKAPAQLPGIRGGSSNLADVNGDGHLDLILTGSSATGNLASVYLGYGDGRFTKADAGLVPVTSSSAALGDVNNDDNLDLAITGVDTSNTESARIYLGNGSGNFNPAGAGLTGIARGSSDFGDVNEDGNLDLLLTGSLSGVVYLGDGGGGFSEAGAGLPSYETSSSSIGDLNGDGHLDLVITGGNSDGPGTDLFFGDGGGGFTEADASANLKGGVYGSSALGDLYNDGTLDLLVTGQREVDFEQVPTASLYRNGSGALPIAPAPATNLTATTTDTDVSLDWTASDSADVAWYRIYRDTAPIDSTDGPSGLTPLDSTDGGTTSFTDASISSGRAYYYRVTAVDGDNIESEFSGEAQVTPGAQLRITGLQPASGVSGAPVRLYGTEFATTASDNSVTLNGVGATVTNATGTALTVEVPSGVSGPVPVAVSTPNNSVTAASRFMAVTGGSGSFIDAGANVLPVTEPNSTWGDFNGDGHLDLVVIGKDSSAQAPITTLYLGDGSGGFTKTEAGLADISPDFVAGEASATGDLNGDGHLDLVLAGEDSNSEDSTRVYLGDGSGAFTQMSSLPVFSCVEVGDVNEDGNSDLLNLSYGGGTVYFGDGTGHFPSSAQIGLNNSFVSNSDLGDVNGDGHLDVVVSGETNDGFPAVRIHLGDGSGRFERANAGLTGLYFGSTEFGDLNEDGALDLVVTGTNLDNIPMMHAYLGDGSGGFNKANADLTGSAFGDLDVGDVNGDGASDIFVAGSDTSYTTVATLYISDGSGGFSRANTDVNAVSSGTTTLADADEDGALDLFVAGLDTSGSASATLYRNEATTTPPPDPPTNLTATTSMGQVSLDWTASDSADVNGYRVYRDTAPIDSAAGPSGRTPLGSTDAGTTSFVDSSVTGGTTYYYRATAVDTDGNESDFSGEVQATPPAPLRITQLQPANGSPGTPVRIYGSGFTSGASNNSVTLGGTSAPIDSAKTNVIYAQVPTGVSGPVSVSVTSSGSSVTAPSRFNVATGGGGAFAPIGADLTGVNLGGADWGDYNGDGASDVVVTGVDSNGTETARIYRNDGNGAFTVLDAGLTGVNGPAEWGDYNGDGALDLVAVGSDSSGAYTATIYRNDGNDAFTAIGAGLTGVASSSVAWGDYNGDGLLDLAVIGLDESDTRSARIYRNEGNGAFAEITAGLTGVRSGDVAWGDYNGDGALDLAIIGSNVDRLDTTTIYRNDGNGSFTSLGANLTGVNLGSVAWGDYNGDGLLDLVLTGEDNDFVRHTTIYQNNGDETFSSVDAGLTGVTFGDVAWGDYNGDGALDLAVIGDSTGTVQARGGTATIYQNDGGGSFSRVGTDLTGVEAGAVDWSDVDQDGALDLAVTGLDSDTNKTATIYRNGAAATAPPTAREDSARVRRGSSRTVAVLANDEAEAGLDPASVTVESGPDHGSTTVSDTGSVVYAHDGSSNFSDSFTYTVADTEGQRSDPTSALLDVFGVDVQAEASLAEGATITLIAAGNFEPGGGTLFARIGGTTRYREIGLAKAGTDPLTFTATIPDSLVTTRGIDYYAVLSSELETATVPAGGQERARQNPAHLPVRFEDLAVPVSVQPETYRMMTVSARPDGGIKAALEQNYGDYDPAEWRVLRWDPSEGSDGDYREYPSIDSLRPGDGFWLITVKGEEFSLGSGQTAGASVARKVPLKSGWNQVGSPFNYAVPWDTIRAASGLSASEVDGPVVFRDSAYRYGQTSLNAWEGAFVRVSGPDTLVVPPAISGGKKGRQDRQAQSKGPVALRGRGSIGRPATGVPTTDPPAAEHSSSEESRAEGVGNRLGEDSGEGALPNDPGPEAPAQTSSPRPEASPEASSAKTTYTLRLGAWPTGGQPHRVWIGVRPEAKAGRDALDFAQAPPIERTVQLAVRETIGDESVPHAGSFKPPSEEGQTWELVLTNRSEQAQETRLRLNSQGTIPSEQNRYVMDLDAKRRVAPGTTFNLKSGEGRRLKVIVGTEAFAKAKSEGIDLSTFKNELRGNYPNPFAQGTTIAYSLKDERRVTIEIYDVLGRRVQTLVRGKKQEAGLHRVQWRVGDRTGAPAGSGVYFYRIEAGDFTDTRKMVIVR